MIEVLKPRSGNLSVLAHDGWFSDRTNSTVWVRIFTSLGIPRDEFIPAFEESVGATGFSGPIAVGVGHLTGMMAPRFETYTCAAADGSLRLQMYTDQRTLEDSNYVFLSTPCKVDGGPAEEFAAKKRLDRLSALICSQIGLNFLKDLVFEGEVNASDGTFTTPSPPIRRPYPSEGPLLTRENWADMLEILEALARIDAGTRSRLERALEFVDRGIRDRNYEGFFYYWTAMEIVARGKAPTIRAKVQKCYNLSRPHDVDKTLGFKVIECWRHGLIHHGFIPSVSADVERYLQLMFLDLLRQELGIPPRGYLVLIQQLPGFDLSQIGLADNRTEEQRAGDRGTTGANQ